MTRKTTKQPQRKAPETYEEFLALAHEQFKTLAADHHIPPANYHYQVGEVVLYGARHSCRVEEVLDNGRLLHISHHDRGESYGISFDNNRRLPLIVWWTDLVPVGPIEETNFSRPRIRMQYMQHDIGSLLHRAYSRGLIDSPIYQRGYVWSLADKQRLVRSVFNRTDIGKFVFLEYAYPENRLEVVDGKQRLNALMEFTQGRFEFEGKTWFQLSGQDKHAFLDVMIQSADLNAEYVKKSDILWLFLSVNTGGVPQTEEHVAKARKLYEEALAEEAKDAG